MITYTKIMHIISGLSVGGAEQMLKRLLVSDMNNKDKVMVVCLSDMGIIGLELQSLGFKVCSLGFGKILLFPFQFWALIKIIKEYKPDIVQTWMYHADLIGGAAAYLSKCRMIIWGIRRSIAPKRQLRTYLVMRLCAVLSYILPKKIICVAESAKNNHGTYGYDVKKMCVIPNGFDFSNFNTSNIDRLQVRRQLNIADSDIVIGCVGRFHSDKGQDVFIKAAAQLNKVQGNKIHFMLVGRNCDSNNKTLMKLIETYGLTPSFILLGEQDNIPHCLAAMDIYCMPSRGEGFPNGLGEAMAMGLSCVATQVGDAALLAGDTVLLVDPDNPEDLARALSEVLDMNLEGRKLMGEKASLRVRSLFSIENAREHYYSLYSKMLGEPF